MTNKQIKKTVKPKLKIPHIIKIDEDDYTTINNDNYLFFLKLHSILLTQFACKSFKM